MVAAKSWTAAAALRQELAEAVELVTFAALPVAAKISGV
jgi:hypothetical protein